MTKMCAIVSRLRKTRRYDGPHTPGAAVRVAKAKDVGAVKSSSGKLLLIRPNRALLFALSFPFVKMRSWTGPARHTAGARVRGSLAMAATDEAYQNAVAFLQKTNPDGESVYEQLASVVGTCARIVVPNLCDPF
tara:strand:+ start:441 stop:842 length:402 start_codon:yes stop_codon:yes gene_type:complete